MTIDSLISNSIFLNLRTKNIKTFFSSMKRLGVFLLPLDGMLVHCRVTRATSIKFPSTHLYTWVERGTVRVKCLNLSIRFFFFQAKREEAK